MKPIILMLDIHKILHLLQYSVHKEIKNSIKTGHKSNQCECRLIEEFRFCLSMKYLLASIEDTWPHHGWSGRFAGATLYG